MARRRVFQTKVECPGITNLGLTSNKSAIVGRTVTFQKLALKSEVAVYLDGAAIGHLDNVVGPQVASAIERGQLFTAVINNAYQNYDKTFKPTTALIYLKVEYVLEKDHSPIEVPKAPVQIHERTSKSFFTKIAGVAHEGRQRIIPRCSVGEHLSLVRDPNNDFDPGAIQVMRLNGEQLGFIPAHVSRNGDPSGLAFHMDRGDKYQCRISALTGGHGNTLGVNVEITEGDEFHDALPTATTPAPLIAVPVHSNFGCLFAAAVVLLLVVALILREC
jgi:hypothetical protein